jgi:hypothetical protein
MGKIKNPNHKLNQPVTEFVENNFAIDRKIKEACTGLLGPAPLLYNRYPDRSS